MVANDVEQLLREIRAARLELPEAHRELLDQIGVQETAVEDWPDGVIDLYRTLNEPTPAPSTITGAAAVWLHERRTVAFNTTALRDAVHGLTTASRRHIVSAVAWHEYGHALSVHRATDEHRRHGLELLALVPDAIREAIDYPNRYRASQVFDEIIAGLYALLVGDVRSSGYVQPNYLHDDVYAAFQEVVPWPQIP
jgi:hypothetical protein